MSSAPDPLRERILDVALVLASEGGYDNVRQREVAANAGVALGTLYKRFRSKEDILSALLERETAALERRLARKPASGADELSRTCDHYAFITRWLCRRPQLGRALLRAMSGGDTHAAENIAKCHAVLVGLAVRAMEGGWAAPTRRQRDAAEILQHVWFAALIGWATGAQSQARVVEIMDLAASAVLAGLAPS
jgi:AcrR family transcriptional regulator